jgi:hypothetical protein
MRTRKAPTAPMKVAHEAARASHLTNLSVRAGRTIRWNAAHGKVERA